MAGILVAKKQVGYVKHSPMQGLATLTAPNVAPPTSFQSRHKHSIQLIQLLQLMHVIPWDESIGSSGNFSPLLMIEYLTLLLYCIVHASVQLP